MVYNIFLKCLRVRAEGLDHGGKYEELGYNGLMSKQGRPKKNMNPEKEEKTNIVNSSPLTDKNMKN